MARKYYGDVLFGAALLGILLAGFFVFNSWFSSDPPSQAPLRDCEADVNATARNCVDAYAHGAKEFDRRIQEVFNALEACIWLEEEGYAAVEESTGPEGWRTAMGRVDDAELYKLKVWQEYHDFYGEADLWDL
jgi:hypothetical protein